jgi:hypothetical protein
MRHLNLWSATTNTTIPGFEKLSATGKASFCRSNRVTFGAQTNVDLGHVVFHAVGLPPSTYNVDRVDAKITAPTCVGPVGNCTLPAVLWSDRALTNHTITFEA